MTQSPRRQSTDDLGVDVGCSELGVHGALDKVCVRTLGSTSRSYPSGEGRYFGEGINGDEDVMVGVLPYI